MASSVLRVPSLAQARLHAEDAPAALRGSKRSAEEAPEDQPNVKVAVAAAADPANDSTVSLDVRLISGESLARISASASSTCAEVKAQLQQSLQSGTSVQALLHGGKQLGHEEAVAQFAGAGRAVVVQAVIGGMPTLLLPEHFAAADLIAGLNRSLAYLESLCPDYTAQGKDFACKADIVYGSMADAPPGARSVADELMKVCGPMTTFEGQLLPGLLSSRGEVIVIVHPGLEPHEACLKALGLSDACHEYVSCEGRSWARSTLSNPYDEYDNGDDDDNESTTSSIFAEESSFVALAKTMAGKLTEHFEFSLAPFVERSPVIRGGYASDGNIVGVLSEKRGEW